jgi:fatty-acyl-CoA synthase
VVVVALNTGQSLSLDDLRSFLAGRVAKWWLPDDLVVVDDVAKTSVGKYDKKAIRASLADRVLP